MERLKGSMRSAIPDDIRAMFPNGIPAVNRLQSVVDGMSQEDLADKITGTLRRIDQAKIREFGSMIASYGERNGVMVPHGVHQGDPRAIGIMLARLAQSEKGITRTMQFLQLASSGRGVTAAALSMSPLGRGGLFALLANPQTRSVVGPIISGLIKR